MNSIADLIYHAGVLLDKLTKPDVGCWEVPGVERYAHISINGKLLYAHRVVLASVTGGMSSGLDACHTCDNPRCVRPSHLFWGTRRENMNDASRKGRLFGRDHAVGEMCGMAKLSPLEVRQIRSMATIGLSSRQIASVFNVDKGTVLGVLSGKTWSHVIGDAHSSVMKDAQ